MSSGGGALARAIGWLHRAEDALLVAILGVMLVLAPLQIALRTFFDESISWGDPLLRVLVLWVGLVGAMVASRGDRHITVDVVSRLVPERAFKGIRVVTSLFAAFVCGVVAYYAYQFVASEREYGSTLFADLPAWLFQLVIPVSFGVIALRYALLCLRDLRDVVTGATGGEEVAG